MTAADWLASLVNALLGSIALVVVVLVARIVARVRRRHPLANRRFLRQYRAERATSRTTVGVNDRCRPQRIEIGGTMTTETPVRLKAFARAIGDELRRAREALGLSRAKFVVGLPSGIGERTLVAYEHGRRMISIVRFMELCEHLGSSAPEMLHRALQTAEIFLGNLTLEVDLRELISAANTRFRPMVPWARNRLKDSRDGIVHLTPSAIRELAAFVGQPQEELARYLATFSPDLSQVAEAA